jgi:hypothetical protein
MPCDLVGERRQGAELLARFWPEFVAKYGIDAPDLPAEILSWEPPRLFEWTWDTDVLRFELEPTATGTRLVFTTWLESQTTAPPHKTAAGYHACLGCLQGLVDERPGIALLDVDVDPLERAYEERF